MSLQANLADVRSALQSFQDGYTKRDVNELDEFMKLFVLNDELEVIGTSAINRFSEEWCKGSSATRALIAGDWESWGDLVLEIADAQIFVSGEVALLSTSGTVSQTIPLEHTYAGMATFLKRFMENRADANIEDEMLTIILGAASALATHRKGEHHVWPIRFTATLRKQQAQWKFQQIHFSYPTIHLPQVRVS